LQCRTSLQAGTSDDDRAPGRRAPGASPWDAVWARDGGKNYRETLQASPNHKVLIRSDLPTRNQGHTPGVSRQYSELDVVRRPMVLD